MRFLIDAQLPPALARFLADQGREALHVGDLSLNDADDSVLWDYAIEQEAILVTKDEDFPHRISHNKKTPVIVWLRIGNTSRRAPLSWFTPLIPQIVLMIQQGERLIEVR